MDPATVVIYVLTIIIGIFIGYRRQRWEAPFVCLIPFVGFAFALLMKCRCANCRELYRPGAKVCPHCGRNTKDGTVTVSR